MKPSTLIAVMREAGVAWWRGESLRHGAALAYYSVFSLAPILVISVGVAGFVFGEEAAAGHVVRELRGLVGPEGGRAIQQLIEKASLDREAGLTATLSGALVLLVGASGAFAELQSALNRIWGARAEPSAGWRRLLRTRLASFSMVLVIGFLLLASLVVSAGIAALEVWAGGRVRILQPLLAALHGGVSLAVVACLFASIFRVLPDVYIPWRDVWLGGALSATLFVVGKAGIGLYLGNTSIASAYGAAGSVVVLLVWIYYSAQILFFGAELTRVMSRRRRGG
jgi:membrane protein